MSESENDEEISVEMNLGKISQARVGTKGLDVISFRFKVQDMKHTFLHIDCYNEKRPSQAFTFIMMPDEFKIFKSMVDKAHSMFQRAKMVQGIKINVQDLKASNE